MPRINEPLDLKSLVDKGVCFEVDSSTVDDPHPSSDEEAALVDRKLQNSNTECLGVFDEDVYVEGEPFDVIAQKMTNLTPNGKIKKRVIREGDGEGPSDLATVKIHYNGYLEYDDEPFDSTYIRNRPHRFTVNDGRVIAGLDFAVRSMKTNEKAQFLIHPDYAYGKNCLIGRVPPNATVLFEVELIEVVNSGAAVSFEKLPQEQQQMFDEVYKCCVALCERGKQEFNNRGLKAAIKDYNTAVCKLEKVALNSKEEVEKHRELAVKLYSNLLVCYTRSAEPRKGCMNAQKIYDLTENGELMKISAKVYFNHAKCLRILCEYDRAKAILEKARRLEPKNPEIINELLTLENHKLEHREQRMAFAKALVGE